MYFYYFYVINRKAKAIKMKHSHTFRLALIAFLLAFISSGHAQWNGFVYEDKNGDGIPEGNEQGAPGADAHLAG